MKHRQTIHNDKKKEPIWKEMALLATNTLASCNYLFIYVSDTSETYRSIVTTSRT